MTPFTYDNGTDKFDFPALTVPEYAILQGRVAESLRKSNRLLLDEQGVQLPAERSRLLKDLDPKSISPVEMETFLADDREARRLLELSLNKAGKRPEEAGEIVAKLTVYERGMIAKHVAGLIDLSPVPESDRKANDKMTALVLKHYPGTDVSKLTMGEFYSLCEQLLPPEAPETPESWFTKNTVEGSVKQLVA